MELILAVAKDYGPVIGLVAYYIWRDYLTAQTAALREERLAVRLNQIEDFQRVEMQKMIITVANALSENTVAKNRFVEAVETRPCLLEKRTLVGG